MLLSSLKEPESENEPEIATEAEPVSSGEDHSSESLRGVIVEQKDPVTCAPRWVLVTVDESQKVQSITPLNDLDPEHRASIAQQTGISIESEDSLPEQLSARFSDIPVVTLGDVSAEGAEAAAAAVNNGGSEPEDDFSSEDPPPAD